MKPWLLVQNAIFAGGMLLLGALAVWRASTPAALPVNADVVNGELAREFESHYDAVFPAKTFGVNLWAALEFKLFGEGRGGVKVGAHGWLYTAEEFRAWPDADARIIERLATILRVRDELARRDAALIVALVPAKARVYPEHLGEHRPARVHERLYPLTRESLRGLRVVAPDLLATMRGCKEFTPVFLRTDTHWTPTGARCAAQSVARAARTARLTTAASLPYRTHATAPRAHRGDLFSFLPLDPYFSRWLPPAEQIAVHRTEAEFAAVEQDLLGTAPAPRVALVGTSYSADARWNFAGALRESLGEDVVSYADAGQGPFEPMQAYLASAEIEAAPPRLVIWEIPERYLPMQEDRAATEPAGNVVPTEETGP